MATGNKKWTWCTSHGSYIAGQAAIDGVDTVALQMEEKWGCGRLRLLVDMPLREKFDRQRYLFNTAIWHGDLEAVRRESARMVTAWTALDKAAEAAGYEKLDPYVWEITLQDGSVAALVPDMAHAKRVMAQGREVRVYDVEELGRILSHWNEINQIKATYPGATIEAVRRPTDPLNQLSDGSRLDDPIPDLVNPMGA
jgi:hypothetical protein